MGLEMELEMGMKMGMGMRWVGDGVGMKMEMGTEIGTSQPCPQHDAFHASHQGLWKSCWALYGDHVWD